MPLSQLPAPSQVPLVPAVMVGMFSLMTPEISSTSGITTDPAATKALKMMKILGIPDEFALSKDDLESLGASLKRAKLPSKKQMNAWLDHVRASKIPFLVISGSSAGFQAVGEVSAQKAGGTHAISPIEHHFPQWNGAPFNTLLTDFWTQSDTGRGQ